MKSGNNNLVYKIGHKIYVGEKKKTKHETRKGVVYRQNTQTIKSSKHRHNKAELKTQKTRVVQK